MCPTLRSAAAAALLACAPGREGDEADARGDARGPGDGAPRPDLGRSRPPIPDALEPDDRPHLPDAGADGRAADLVMDASGMNATTPDAAVERAPDASTCGEPPPNAPCGRNGRGRVPWRCADGEYHAAGPCVDPDACVDGEAGGMPCGERPAETASAVCVAGRWSVEGPCVDRVCDLATPAMIGETLAPEAEVAADSGSCGGAGRERAFVFTAPAAALYRFGADGLSYGAALYIRERCAAPESELACVAGPRGTPPGLELALPAGAVVAVVVDALGAHGGPVPLKIDALADPPQGDPAGPEPM